MDRQQWQLWPNEWQRMSVGREIKAYEYECSSSTALTKDALFVIEYSSAMKFFSQSINPTNLPCRTKLSSWWTIVNAVRGAFFAREARSLKLTMFVLSYHLLVYCCRVDACITIERKKTTSRKSCSCLANSVLFLHFLSQSNKMRECRASRRVAVAK